jgi:hypothetical protein
MAKRFIMSANRITRKPLGGRTKQSEKKVEKALRTAVQKAGGIPVKMALMGTRGFPDQLIMMPGGRIAFVECKTTGEKLKPRQIVWRDWLLDMGFKWHLLDHTDDIPDIIKSMQ